MSPRRFSASEFQHVIKQDVIQKCTPFYLCSCCHYIAHVRINAETILGRTSTVVKKDTASCDIVHGTGSSRSEINGEAITRRSTVVKKDIASCDVVHGSRSKINGATIMRRSTVVKNDKAALSNVGSTNCRMPTPKHAGGETRESEEEIDSLLVEASLREHSKGYTPSNEMRGLRIAQLLGEWPEIERGASQPIWGSLARTTT